jgi:hypothetical protein
MGALQQVSPGLVLSATSGLITAPFVADANGYIYQPIQTGVADGGSAVFTFTATNSGSYTVSALVSAPNDGANSFYVNIDAQPTDPLMIWDIPVTTALTSQTVTWRGSGTDITPQYTPKVFALSAGVHQLIVRGREAGAQLGQITIAPVAPEVTVQLSPPSNLHISF